MKLAEYMLAEASKYRWFKLPAQYDKTQKGIIALICRLADEELKSFVDSNTKNQISSHIEMSDLRLKLARCQSEKRELELAFEKHKMLSEAELTVLRSVKIREMEHDIYIHSREVSDLTIELGNYKRKHGDKI